VEKSYVSAKKKRKRRKKRTEPVIPVSPALIICELHLFFLMNSHSLSLKTKRQMEIFIYTNSKNEVHSKKDH
jgi:hypothetical protein